MKCVRACRMALVPLLMAWAGCSGSGTAVTTDSVGADALPIVDVKAESFEPETVVFVETVSKETFERIVKSIF